MIRPRVLTFVLALACLFAVPAGAAESVRSFDSPEERARYYGLLDELRCLVCQNESLASSNADLAQDLRDEVYRLVVREDRSRDAAIDYLTNRYGDFVLYRPPVKPMTWLLWFGPVLMLGVGAAVLAYIVRERRRLDESGLSPAERARADRLLQGNDEDSA